MNVTVHTRPQCQPCRLTKRKLDQLDIDYVEKELTDPQRFLALELMTAPVVEVDLGDGAAWRWAGYSPSQIEVLEHIYGCDDPECGYCWNAI